MQRSFATLDVFTDRRFAGNPLAVVLEAEGLDSTAMQAIAREFGHPETVFALITEKADCRARLRIFTPFRELPFAGHPTVGTAVLFGLRDGNAAGHRIVLEENIGPVHCTFEPGAGRHGSARFTVPQLPVQAGAVAEDAAIAAALSLDPAEIGFGSFRPARWSAGIACTFVPVAGLTTVARCRPDHAEFGTVFGDDPVYVFCGDSVDPGHDLHARMFAPALGVAEDPATGSAAAAFTGLYAAASRLAEGEHAVAIEQGYEMGRPSLIRLTIEIEEGKVVSASIGGSAVVVTEGRIEA
jgi:trans-2,3-dihydro-3-hydroxyanthranilate isomerase